MSNYDISDLGKMIKSAREKALKGVYHESFELYKNCLELVQSKVKLSTDSNLKEQWFKTGQNIKQELLEVKEILDCCYTFRMEKKEESANINNNMILRDYLDHGANNLGKNRINNIQENDQFKRMYSNDDQNRGANDRQKEDENLDKKRFERFGGKVPFEHHNKNYSEEKQDSGINNQPPRVNQQKNSDNYNLRKNYSNINVGKKPINLDVEKKRNYEKPWKGDDKDNKDKKNKNEKEVKKSDKR